MVATDTDVTLSEQMRRERNGVDPASAELLEHPLRARSVIGSLLLGVHPPRLPGARIVEWCARFGIAEGTARTAMSRMVDRGELRTDGGLYELAGRVRALQPAQDWSLAPDLAPWDGSWRLAVVGGAARDPTRRAALRTAMRRLRFGEAREGVWTRPDNLPRAAAPEESWRAVDAQCAWWSATPETDPGQLAAELFLPDSWAGRARDLVARLEAVTTELASGAETALAPGFVIGAATLQHARRDPLLPPALLPAAWPGDDLRATYRRFETTFATTLAAVLRR